MKTLLALILLTIISCGQHHKYRMECEPVFQTGSEFECYCTRTSNYNNKDVKVYSKWFYNYQEAQQYCTDMSENY